MRGKYEVRGDKENNYEAPTPSANYRQMNVSSNNALRRKIEENLSRNEEQHSKYQGHQFYKRDDKPQKYGKSSQFLQEHSVNQISKNTEIVQKRQNAKKRQFDVKVNNISALNDKIQNLLTLVKKQKRFEEKDKTFDSKLKDISLDISKRPLYDRKRAPGSISPFNAVENHIQMPKKYDFDSKQLSPTPKMKNYNEEKEGRHMRAISNIQTPPRTKNLREIEAEGRSLRRLKEEELDKQLTQKRNYGLKYDYSTFQIQEPQEETISQVRSKYFQKYAKDERKSSQISKAFTQNETKDFNARDKGYERELRFQNFKELQEIQKYSKLNLNISDRQQQSTLLTLNSIKTTGKDMSPIKNLSIYERPRLKNREYDPIPLSVQSPAKGLNYQKTTTASMIDEQIMKIKSKIQESEESKHKLQKKYQDLHIQERNYDPNAGKLYSNRNAVQQKANNYQQKVNNFQQKLNNYQQKANSFQQKTKNKKFQIKVYPVQNTKVTVTKLVQKLNNQIKLDINLRSRRQAFEEYLNPDKWNPLRKDLQRRGIDLSEKELQDLMKISGDEHNPFTTQKSPQLNDISQVAECIAASEQYWNKEIERCVSQKELQSEGFSIQDIDLNKKGYLNIEDLVCFINLYSGNFYRNRDVSMLYKRFTRLERKAGSGIEYKTFLGKVSFR